MSGARLESVVHDNQSGSEHCKDPTVSNRIGKREIAVVLGRDDASLEVDVGEPAFRVA